MQTNRIRLKRRNAIKKTVFLFCLFLLLLIAIVWVSRDSRMLIANINLTGNKAVQKEELLSIVDNELSGNYFFAFPKKNILLYPKTTINKKIMDSFKRIHYVDIRINNFTSIDILVKERMPYTMWCGENLLVDTTSSLSKKCYFSDDKGFIFAEAPTFSNDVYFTIFGELTYTDDSREVVGSSFLNEKKFTNLMQIRSLFEKEGIVSIKLNTLPENDFELYLKDGGKFIFNINQDTAKLVSNAIVAIDAKKKELIEVSPSTDRASIFKNLEYIDLRFNNKVIFKFVEE